MCVYFLYRSGEGFTQIRRRRDTCVRVNIELRFDILVVEMNNSRGYYVQAVHGRRSVGDDSKKKNFEQIHTSVKYPLCCVNIMSFGRWWIH